VHIDRAMTTTTSTKGLKRIGRGSFTTAYKKENDCILHSIDTVKIAMAEGFTPDHRMFPKVEFLDSYFNADDDRVNVLKMDYMPRPSSIKQNVTARQWRLYKWLESVFQTVLHSFDLGNYERMDLQYDLFRDCPSEFKAESEAITEMLDGLRNYCNIVVFEISPRNVTVKGGKLVLLDCFFDLELLENVRRREREKHLSPCERIIRYI
tara:strand:+ start:12680 stop:13303 length:624 start_codon:yes stop_codon:yes gene_type:complete